jgi:hypothetical protein
MEILRFYRSLQRLGWLYTQLTQLDIHLLEATATLVMICWTSWGSLGFALVSPTEKQDQGTISNKQLLGTWIFSVVSVDFVFLLG